MTIYKVSINHFELVLYENKVLTYADKALRLRPHASLASWSHALHFFHIAFLAVFQHMDINLINPYGL